MNVRKVLAGVAVLLLLITAFVMISVWRAFRDPAQGSFGLAAVSFGINELVVEAIILLMIVFVGWRTWRFLKQLRQRPQARP